MSYKIIKVASYYKDFFYNYYKTYPTISSENYDFQLQHLMRQFNGWADFYSTNLNKLNNQSHEIVANATFLQNAWARENNSKSKDFQLVYEQLKKQNPDVVWFQDSLTFNGEFINYLKNNIKSIKIVIGNSCAPYTNEQLNCFKSFDFITTCSPLFKQKFEKEGMKVLLLYQAFEPQIIENLKDNDIKHQFVFIGSILAGKGFHEERKNYILSLLKKNIDLQVFGNINNTKFWDVKKKQLLYILVTSLKILPFSKTFNNNNIYKKGIALTSFPQNISINKKYLNNFKDSVFGLEMFELLKNSKLNLNIHGEVAGNYAANMRMFETTGVGCCLLTDAKKNLNQLFTEDTEVVSFKNVDDCVEKASWLLKNPKKMQEIAENGQKRTLKDHTYYQRAEELNDYIKLFFRQK